MPSCSACGAELAVEARFCHACGAPVALPAPAAEERKVATVLFADLVGSTELGASQDPERTRALLQRFYDAMKTEIEAAGGTVEKFVGDAVMAAFGAPAAQEDHAERALHAALSMQRRLDELFGQSLRLRVGVNTGEVVVGSPQDGGSFVTGDAVNVAARLEQAAAPGEILVGERTAVAVRGAFELDEPTTVQAKGKPGGVSCRRVVRSLTLMRPRGISGMQRAFVGRDAELALLDATYRRAVDQAEPHLVSLIGDSGVGKTRLVRELWDRLGKEDPEPLRRTGRCLPYGRGITYWPLAEMLREHFAILDSDPPEQARRRLGERAVLGLALGLDVAPGMHPLAAREQLHEGFAAFLSALVASRPAVLLVEDLHWAEEPLLDLLERLLRDVRGPLLVLATARPELLDDVRPGWGTSGRNSSTIRLEPLTAAASGQLLAELLGAEPPADLAKLVGERSEGNPLFVEELLQTLIDEGVLVRGDDGWSARPLPKGFELPDTVTTVVAARIDLLPPVEKAALQAASVIGRVFWTEPVGELLEGAEANFALLEERDFVRRRPGSSMAGQEEYAIKHGVIREVAYASLPKARRAHLHAAFAGWIERSASGGDELAALLAHHYAEAVRPEDADLAWVGQEGELAGLRTKAIAWLRRAAAQAVARYDIDDGLALLQRALELEEDREQRARILFEIGHAHALKFEGEKFWTTMEQAIELTEDKQLTADAYAELVMQTTGRAGMWKQMPDSALIESWIEKALTQTAPGSRAQAQALLGRSFWQRDDRAAAEASAIAERLGDPDLRASAWVARSFAHARVSDFGEALAWAQRGFDIIADIHDPDIATDVYAAALGAATGSGRFREARRLAYENNELNSWLTPHHRVHGIAVMLEIEELAGCWEEIFRLEAPVFEAIEANLDTPCVRNPRSLLVFARAYEHAGNAEEAARLEAQADEMGYDARIALAGPRIQLALARGDLGAAEEAVAWLTSQGAMASWFHLSASSAKLDALATLGDRDAVETEAPPLAKPRTYLEPFALRALGIVQEDEQLIGRALERFEAMGLEWHAGKTRGLLGL